MKGQKKELRGQDWGVKRSLGEAEHVKGEGGNRISRKEAPVERHIDKHDRSSRFVD